MKKFLTLLTDTFGNTWLVKQITNVLHSLNNTKLGYSGKKITAAVCIGCVIKITNAYVDKGDFSNITLVLTAFFTFIATLFGINEYSKKIRTDNKNEADDTTNS